MKMKGSLQLCLLVLALGCLPAAAENTGFYAGAGIGFSELDAGGGGISFDDDDTGWKLFGGYDVSPNIAVEVFWVDLGDFSDTVLGVPVKFEVDGIGAAGVGSLPVSDMFSVHAKLGIWAWDAEARAGAVSADDDGADIMFGLGGSYTPGGAFSVRLEWERYTADSDDADLFAISGVYHF